MLIKKSDIPEIKPEEAEDEPYGPTIRTGGNNRTFLAKKLTNVRTSLGKLEPESYFHIVTKGNWSSPHLIEEILEQIGPAECWLTSWSIKEQAVRILLNLRTQGLLTGLTCIFDERIRVQCPDAHKLAAQNIGKIHLAKCHAKVIVLMNDDWAVDVVTSANQTRNPRIERYVVTTFREVAEFDRGWIEDELHKKKPFECENSPKKK